MTFIQKNIDDIKENLGILTEYLFALINLIDIKKTILNNKIEFIQDRKKLFLEKRQEYTHNEKILEKLYDFWEKRILENN